MKFRLDIDAEFERPADIGNIVRTADALEIELKRYLEAFPGAENVSAQMNWENMEDQPSDDDLP